MDSCDVLIVGGGPAGSSCAWGLRNSGLAVAVLDKQVFPRDKVCGGWITPAVLTGLEIDPPEYGRDRVMQPITGFRVGCVDGVPVEASYTEPVSYGIRRREFDDYLLKRSRARLILGAPLTSLVREAGGWIANDQIRARMVIGAGGHFCPVARLTGAKVDGGPAVVAQETEFEMSPDQIASCRIHADTPELYFSPDLKGYGWCFRKANVLNVGLGRAGCAGPRRLPEHVAHFLGFLKASSRISFSVPPLRGHAYLLEGTSTRNMVSDGVLLIGDAAGLAYPFSGEGIRPAVESGLLAAKVIAAAEGTYTVQRLDGYRSQIAARHKTQTQRWSVTWGTTLSTTIGRLLPPSWISAAAQLLLRSPWFVRNIVLDQWFLSW